ncbi:hypothetical protein FB558_3722 [Pseudonocardia kunmingensis]|uniref:Uncharacterized protein n=1 Tax=Pseudonocardia kunmingensis TaxID=630975 RepID=A0A543DPC7_9PSEU|nr:hypothetical protein FB558_3722 [Pseudonocardia kunmingensis]
MPALTLVSGINRRTPTQAGTALARLVLDPQLADTTGRYFNGTREVRSSAESYDTRKAADLWGTSTTLTADPARTLRFPLEGASMRRISQEQIRRNADRPGVTARVLPPSPVVRRREERSSYGPPDGFAQDGRARRPPDPRADRPRRAGGRRPAPLGDGAAGDLRGSPPDHAGGPADPRVRRPADREDRQGRWPASRRPPNRLGSQAGRRPAPGPGRTAERHAHGATGDRSHPAGRSRPAAVPLTARVPGGSGEPGLLRGTARRPPPTCPLPRRPSSSWTRVCLLRAEPRSPGALQTPGDKSATHDDPAEPGEDERPAMEHTLFSGANGLDQCSGPTGGFDA